MMGLVLLTALSAFVAISGVVVDFTPTHVYNPTWPPHARFHGYLSIARTVLIMAAVVVLAWGPVSAGARVGGAVLALRRLGWHGRCLAAARTRQCSGAGAPC